jgi:predicted nuclease with RNAse H fold
MRTLGVDLASQSRNTAVCVLDWGDTDVVVVELHRGADNRRIRSSMDECDVTGIDAPFGWPERFRSVITTWAEQGRWSEGWDPGATRALRLRTTDLWVHEQTGKWPLSVAADSIAVCAMRAAAVLTAAAPPGVPLDRIDGPWFEVYPGAALAAWHLVELSTGYKRHAAARDALVGAVTARAGITLSEEHRALCVASDHVLDALLCALVARAAATDRTHQPPSQLDREVIAREGWIHLPLEDSLETLRYEARRSAAGA